MKENTKIQQLKITNYITNDKKKKKKKKKKRPGH